MPTATHANGGIKIKSNKTVKVQTIAFRKGVNIYDLELQVSYNCSNGLFVVGRSLDRAKFVSEEDGFSIYKLNKHFYTEEGFEPGAVSFDICERDRIKPKEIEFEFKFINPPEHGIETEAEIEEENY